MAFTVNVQMSATGLSKDFGEVCTGSWGNEQDFIKFLRMMGADSEQILDFIEKGDMQFVTTRQEKEWPNRTFTMRYRYFRQKEA